MTTSTASTASTGRLLTDFTAYDLPAKKWMKIIGPKVRLRVRGKRCNFVSSVVEVGNQRLNSESDAATDSSAPDTVTHWSWNVGEQFSRQYDEPFEILIKRRFLLGYKRIRRTKSVTAGKVRAGGHKLCTLSLYDGEYSAGQLEGKIEIGRITFMMS